MSETPRPGRDDAQVVAADPFWSVVRRRHPDVDIVLIPEDATIPSVGPDAAPLVDPEEQAERWESEAGRWWRAVAGDRPPGEVSARWTTGEAPGSSRRETTWRMDDADQVQAISALQRVDGLLRDDGWRVLAPADGMPRVLAGRDTTSGRAELQLVLDPASSRLVLRLRSGDVRLRAEGVS